MEKVEKITMSKLESEIFTLVTARIKDCLNKFKNDKYILKETDKILKKTFHSSIEKLVGLKMNDNGELEFNKSPHLGGQWLKAIKEKIHSIPQEYFNRFFTDVLSEKDEKEIKVFAKKHYIERLKYYLTFQLNNLAHNHADKFMHEVEQMINLDNHIKALQHLKN